MRYKVGYNLEIRGWCVMQSKTGKAVSEPRKRIAEAQRDFYNDGWHAKNEQAISDQIQDRG